MDEPFGALDAMTRREMWRWLEDLWRQRKPTIIMVTHDVEEATALSHRIVVTTPRPAKVRTEVVVTLPRPRDTSSREFFSSKIKFYKPLRAEILDQPKGPTMQSGHGLFLTCFTADDSAFGRKSIDG